jgi:hypothetical protein
MVMQQFGLCTVERYMSVHKMKTMGVPMKAKTVRSVCSADPHVAVNNTELLSVDKESKTG